MVFGNLNSVNPDMSIIPSFASLNEATYYALGANEATFTEMLKNIGIRELGLFESAGSSTLLYEAEGDAETKKEIEKFKVSVWTRIKTLFENALLKIKTIIQKFIVSIQMHFGKKALDRDGYKNLVGVLSKMGDAKVSRYPWDGLQDTINNFNDALSLCSFDNIKTANKYGDDAKISSLGIRRYLRADSNNLAKYKSAFEKGETSSVKDVEKKDLYIRKLSAQEFESIFKSCTDFKLTEANLKTMYTTAKSRIDASAKSQSYDVGIYDSDHQDEKSAAKHELKAIKYLSQVCTLWAGTTLSEYYSMISSNMSIITQVFRKYNSEKNKEKSKNESAYYGDSELSSLFDWSY